MKQRCDGCERDDIEIVKVIGGFSCKRCLINDELWEFLRKDQAVNQMGSQ